MLHMFEIFVYVKVANDLMRKLWQATDRMPVDSGLCILLIQTTVMSQ
jgi:hypothetical protein